MKRLFADTHALIALADAADPAHEFSVAVRDRWIEQSGLLITTDYVADETLTLLRFRLDLDAADGLWWQAEGNSCLCWAFVNLMRAEKARALFLRYRRKPFSFTDCTSFVVMRELKLREVLTTDRNFEQAGFIALPKAAAPTRL